MTGRLKLVGRLLLTYSVTYAAVFLFWDLGEDMEPGRQYADPLWPVAYCSLLFCMPILAVILARAFRRGVF